MDEIFTLLECTVVWYLKEGDYFDGSLQKIKIATVKGSANKLLQGERTALNLLARCSGIALRYSLRLNEWWVESNA